MEFKGTKGNLELFGECQLNKYNFYIQSISTSSSESMLFCNVYGKTEQETKANALLISKSKEMLDMLKKIQCETDPHSQSKRWGEIEQLIKEATEL